MNIPPTLEEELEKLKAQESLCEGCDGRSCPKADQWRKNYRLVKKYLGAWDKEGRWLIASDECSFKTKYVCAVE